MIAYRIVIGIDAAGIVHAAKFERRDPNAGATHTAEWVRVRDLTGDDVPPAMVAGYVHGVIASIRAGDEDLDAGIGRDGRFDDEASDDPPLEVGR